MCTHRKANNANFAISIYPIRVSIYQQIHGKFADSFSFSLTLALSRKFAGYITRHVTPHFYDKRNYALRRVAKSIFHTLYKLTPFSRKNGQETTAVPVIGKVPSA